MEIINEKITLYINFFTYRSYVYFYSFPTVESNTFTQIESVDKEDRKLTKNQKISWFLAGLFGGIIGVVVRYYLNYCIKKKKGQFKFNILGFGGRISDFIRSY